MNRNTVVPSVGRVVLIANMNIRSRAPRLSMPVARREVRGTTIHVRNLLQGDTVRGSDTWYETADGHYFWAGGAESPQVAPQAVQQDATLNVRRRTDGTIQPLNIAELGAEFGVFRYRDAAGGRIDIESAWVDANIATLEHPVLMRVSGRPSIRVHVKAVRPMWQVLEAVANGNLAQRVITMDGTFVPRHRNWNKSKPLSSHSWGVAIDLNSAWNGYGKAPAPLGEHGNLQELVPIFNAAGFAWGGHFSEPDGMHFELACRGLPE